MTITTVKYKGADYEIENGDVFVMKARPCRGHDYRSRAEVGTYRSRITSAPKIKRILKLAAQGGTNVDLTHHQG